MSRPKAYTSFGIQDEIIPGSDKKFKDDYVTDRLRLQLWTLRLE